MKNRISVYHYINDVRKFGTYPLIDNSHWFDINDTRAALRKMNGHLTDQIWAQLTILATMYSAQEFVQQYEAHFRSQRCFPLQPIV